MAIQGKKLSELTDKVTDIQGTERIYVSDGTGIPKYIETNQLAKKEEIPDTSGFITQSQADGKYQPKGEYALKSEIPDTSAFATKEDLSGKLDVSTYNEEKANFATKSEIGEINTILDTINGESV